MIRDIVKNKLQPLFPNTGILQNDIKRGWRYTQPEAAQGSANFPHILLLSLVYVVFRKNIIYPAFILLPQVYYHPVGLIDVINVGDPELMHSSSESYVNSV